MKKIVLLTVSVLTAGLVFAQYDGANGGPWQRGGRYVENAGEELVLNGKLEWANGRIAVKTNDKTYFISGIQQLLGFVDGLKEGSQVTLSGWAYGIPYITEYGFVRAEKLTFNGKEYTLAPAGGHHFNAPKHNGRYGPGAPGPAPGAPGNTRRGL